MEDVARTTVMRQRDDDQLVDRSAPSSQPQPLDTGSIGAVAVTDGDRSRVEPDDVAALQSAGRFDGFPRRRVRGR